jgi:hypothetical protein
MSTRTKLMNLLASAVIATFVFQCAQAQYEQPRTAPRTIPPMSDVAKAVKAAADAMGMTRTGGPGGALLPEIDVVNRMEFWGSGTASAPGASAQAFKTEYRAALGYNPPAMRVEMTPAQGSGGQPAQQRMIRTVRDNYAWNESEPGAGLEPGRGTATPDMAAVKGRLLRLWMLPYGVVKAAFAAGDKTKLSVENGATVLTFPLSGELAGVTVKATLDAKNFITKVETQSDNPALVRQAEYSDYADHGEILTDIKSPGHIVEKQGGATVLDIQIKSWDANNPYVVFPVPPNVKKTGTQQSANRAQ